uniref:Protein kinase domain-containing protein n=1 Tax=Chromera velia CCMP2878 TaxID=1169474 RepID=A0A0G4HNL4_9ALVE|eukprot:Cvel_29533.t1-p1 / transcript=Cvel_29533.t1 / gene=Cvel_29533 / organism=Chromera_velia_CCMP2878 / gene_product=Cyclin-dependent kinase C-1, putative / transcript_product=Cyclin-dependent kinase C-1, putative / location=Cvel_scaffold4057:341-10882(-) / protein_length=1342 / sequence_SO=supercontig / SO=protein_coding / is_pseudo=false
MDEHMGFGRLMTSILKRDEPFIPSESATGLELEYTPSKIGTGAYGDVVSCTVARPRKDGGPLRCAAKLLRRLESSGQFSRSIVRELYIPRTHVGEATMDLAYYAEKPEIPRKIRAAPPSDLEDSEDDRGDNKKRQKKEPLPEVKEKKTQKKEGQEDVKMDGSGEADRKDEAAAKDQQPLPSSSAAAPAAAAAAAVTSAPAALQSPAVLSVMSAPPSSPEPMNPAGQAEQPAALDDLDEAPEMMQILGRSQSHNSGLGKAEEEADPGRGDNKQEGKESGNMMKGKNGGTGRAGGKLVEIPERFKPDNSSENLFGKLWLLSSFCPADLKKLTAYLRSRDQEFQKQYKPDRRRFQHYYPPKEGEDPRITRKRQYYLKCTAPFAAQSLQGTFSKRGEWGPGMGTGWRGTLTERESKRVIWDVCSALKTLHDRGVVHRDIKSANVLISQDGRCHLTDFGLARELPLLQTDPQAWRGTIGTSEPPRMCLGPGKRPTTFSRTHKYMDTALKNHQRRSARSSRKHRASPSHPAVRPRIRAASLSMDEPPSSALAAAAVPAVYPGSCWLSGGQPVAAPNLTRNGQAGEGGKKEGEGKDKQKNREGDKDKEKSGEGDKDKEKNGEGDKDKDKNGEGDKDKEKSGEGDKDTGKDGGEGKKKRKRPRKSKLPESTDAGSELSTCVITSLYRPPELFLGATHYGLEVDIWSLGVLMVEVLTGSAPFHDREIDEEMIVFQIFKKVEMMPGHVREKIEKEEFYKQFEQVHKQRLLALKKFWNKVRSNEQGIIDKEPLLFSDQRKNNHTFKAYMSALRKRSAELEAHYKKQEDPATGKHYTKLERMRETSDPRIQQRVLLRKGDRDETPEEVDRKVKELLEEERRIAPDPLIPEGVHVSEEGRDLISQMLQMDPAKRPTARQVLSHKWFDDFRAELDADFRRKRKEREEEEAKERSGLHGGLVFGGAGMGISLETIRARSHSSTGFKREEEKVWLPVHSLPPDLHNESALVLIATPHPEEDVTPHEPPPSTIPPTSSYGGGYGYPPASSSSYSRSRDHSYGGSFHYQPSTGPLIGDQALMPPPSELPPRISGPSGGGGGHGVGFGLSSQTPGSRHQAPYPPHPSQSHQVWRQDNSYGTHPSHRDPNQQQQQQLGSSTHSGMQRSNGSSSYQENRGFPPRDNYSHQHRNFPPSGQSQSSFGPPHGSSGDAPLLSRPFVPAPFGQGQGGGTSVKSRWDQQQPSRPNPSGSPTMRDRGGGGHFDPRGRNYGSQHGDRMMPSSSAFPPTHSASAMQGSSPPSSSSRTNPNPGPDAGQRAMPQRPPGTSQAPAPGAQSGSTAPADLLSGKKVTGVSFVKRKKG